MAFTSKREDVSIDKHMWITYFPNWNPYTLLMELRNGAQCLSASRKLRSRTTI